MHHHNALMVSDLFVNHRCPRTSHSLRASLLILLMLSVLLANVARYLQILWPFVPGLQKTRDNPLTSSFRPVLRRCKVKGRTSGGLNHKAR